jgi:hypothetical protein
MLDGVRPAAGSFVAGTERYGHQQPAQRAQPAPAVPSASRQDSRTDGPQAPVLSPFRAPIDGRRGGIRSHALLRARPGTGQRVRRDDEPVLHRCGRVRGEGGHALSLAPGTAPQATTVPAEAVLGGAAAAERCCPAGGRQGRGSGHAAGFADTGHNADTVRAGLRPRREHPVLRLHRAYGDTLSKIATQFGLRAAAAWRPGSCWSRATSRTSSARGPIQPGQKLRVPLNNGIVHTVLTGGLSASWRGLRRHRSGDQRGRRQRQPDHRAGAAHPRPAATACAEGRGEPGARRESGRESTNAYSGLERRRR